MKTSTKTNTVTNTHIAVATLAVVAATAVALAAAPRVARQVPPIEQCQPMRAEFSRPCAGAAGFRQISFNCPSRPNVRKTSLRSPNCRSEEALVASAARNCQNARRCAAVAPPAAVPGYGYNAPAPSAMASATLPIVEWTADSPNFDGGTPLVRGARSLVGQFRVTNPNDRQLYIENTAFELLGAGIRFGRGDDKLRLTVENGPVSSSTILLTTTVPARRFEAESSLASSYVETPYQEVAISARSSEIFSIYLDTDGMAGSTGTSTFGISLPRNAIYWRIGEVQGQIERNPNQGDHFTFPGNIYTTIVRESTYRRLY